MNVYRLLADATVAAHLAYVLFVLVGLILILAGLVFRWRWIRNFYFRLLHLAMIGLVVAQALFGFVCPLTTLEQALREKAGGSQYSGSFIGHWAHELLFYEGPPWVFTLCYSLFGAAVLATFLFAPPRWPWGASKRSGE